MLRLERLKPEIEALGRSAVKQHRRRAKEVEVALRWLRELPGAVEVRKQVGAVHEEAPALPATDAPLQKQVPPPSSPPRSTTVVAVDGSQIPPDRHGAVLYYLIQVGGLVFRYDGQAPTPHTEAHLYFDEEELYDEEGLLISYQLGMRRAVAEMTFLAALTEAAGRDATRLPLHALVDGPLLWPYTVRGKEAEENRRAYLEALDRLREAGGLPAGFTERPGGRPLLDLLWLSRLAPEGGPRNAAEEPLRAIDDRHLARAVLGPGERSPWLVRKTATNEVHRRAGHPIWFCYLNVGEEDRPVIARLEVPEWAAVQEGWVEALHAVLVHQARVLGGNPYVLARAHEEAVVTSRDRAALNSLLQRRLLEHGLIRRASEKARQKSYLGRR